jgi:hypothetical protein
MSKRGVQRDDFREVKPTPEERADWYKKHPGRNFSLPYRVEHKPCGKRMWYSGLGIGSHLRACKPKPTGPKVGVVMSSQLGDDWRPSTHLINYLDDVHERWHG